MLLHFLKQKKWAYFLLLVSLFAGINCHTVLASHMGGIDLTYTCINAATNTYRIRLTFYRDCAGIAASTSEFIQISNDCGLPNPGGGSLILPQVNTPIVVTPICPAFTTTCVVGGTYPGIEEYVYEADVTLPGVCNSWRFTWSSCCRNASITNVPLPSGLSIYAEAIYNSAVPGVGCNNSPQFTIPPIYFACAGQPFTFNLGAFDPDGDELEYQIICPREDATTPVNYNTGLSCTQPITTAPPAGTSINTVTGNITVNVPSVPQTTIMAVRVNEYRMIGGVRTLIGSVMRDMQITFLTCTNTNPTNTTITSVGGSATQTGPNSITVCAGQNVTAQFTSSDPDASQVLTMTVAGLSLFPGATFTTSGTNPITGTFTWTPPLSSVGSNNIYVTVKDDACPLNGQSFVGFTINVESGVYATPSTASACGEPIQLNAYGATSYTWNVISQPAGGNPNFSSTTIANPIISPSVVGTYVLEVVGSGTPAGCPNRDTITINVVPSFNLDIIPSFAGVTCQGVSRTLTATPDVAGTYSYSWSPAAGLSATNVQSPTANPSTSTWYYVTVTSAAGCVRTDSFFVQVSPFAPPIMVPVTPVNICGSNPALGGPPPQPLVVNVTSGTGAPTSCGAATQPCGGPTSMYILGTGTLSQGTTGYPNPFGQWYSQSRHQMIYRASEFAALGWVTGGNITAIELIVTQKNSTFPYTNFTIRMGCTSQNTFTTNTFFTGLTTVYSNPSYNTVLGSNLFTLSTPFQWDGSSNIVVDICFTRPNGSYSLNDPVNHTNLGAGNNVTLYSISDFNQLMCSNTSGTSSTRRANMRFYGCPVGASLSNYTFSWSPATGVGNPTQPVTTVNPGAAGTYTYTLTATDNFGCQTSASVVVNVCPDRPDALPSDSVGCTGFRALWRTLSGATGYRLDVATTSSFAAGTFVPGYQDLYVAAPDTDVSVVGLTPGTTYYYRVRAELAGPTTTDHSDTITVTTLTLPGVPVATAASNIGCTSFDANWQAVSGATGYRLDVSTDIGFGSFVAGYANLAVGGLSHTVTGLVPGTTYYYRVRSENSCGVSANSNVISVSTLPLPVAPVANAATNVGCTSFDANWSVSPLPAIPQDVYIEVSTDAGFGSFVGIYNGLLVSGSPVVVTGLTPGVTYYYRLRATNVCGTSAYSNVEAVTTNPLPTVPTALAASNVGCTSFDANWSVFPAPVFPQTYLLTVATSLGFGGSIVAGYNQLPVAGLSQSVTGLSPGVTYYYRVEAVNACGTSAASNVISVSTNPLPQAPVLNAATGIGCTGFSISWIAGLFAAGYELEVADNAGFAPLLSGYNPLTLSGVSTLVSGLMPGTVYYVRVRSINACGSSVYSNTQAVITNPTPAVPLTVAATGAGCTGFTANWTAAADATQYELEVSDNAGFVPLLAPYTPLTLAAPQVSQSITGLTPGVTYYYRVRARNSCGVSVNSNVTYVSTNPLPAVPLAEPASLIGCNSFQANWQAALHATGYRLDVATDAGFTALVLPYNNMLVAGTNALVAGLSPGVTYYYRIRGENSCGVSVNSNVISAVTNALPAISVADPASLVGCTGFTANWQSAAGAVNYFLTVATSLGFGGSIVSGYNQLPVSGLSQSVTGLSPGVTYYYRVEAVNACGVSAASNVVSVSTLPGPGVPVALAATGVGCSGFTANWQAAANATNYFLTVATSPVFGSGSIVSGYNQLPVVGLSQNVTGLTAGVTYYYRVEAVNSCGVSAVSNTITVNVVPLPGLPVALAASNIGCTGFTANWSVSSDAAGYYLDIATDAGFVSFVLPYNNFFTTATSQVVTGLLPGNTYYYRLRATNSCGTTVSSNVIDAATLPMPGLPVLAPLNNITCDGMTASWTAGTDATNYLVEVATDAGFMSLVAGYNPANVTGTVLNITGLSLGTVYYVRVRSQNSCGTGAWSVVQSGVTNALPAVLTATAAVNVTCSSFLATWQGALGADNYRLDVAADAGFTALLPGYADLLILGGGTTSWPVSGLNLGTTYYYRLRAQNSCGTTVNSNVISVTTDNLPAAPVVLPASNIGCRDFTANWSAVSGVSGYLLDVSTDAGFGSFVGIYNGLALGAVSSRPVVGLSSGTTYYYRLRAQNSCGSSVVSGVMNVMTNPLPEVPVALPATDIGCSYFTANWTPALHATGYVIDVSEDPAFLSFYGVYFNYPVGSGTNAWIGGLLQGRTYYYRIRATNSCGQSAGSNAISVLVLPAVLPNPPDAMDTVKVCLGSRALLVPSSGYSDAVYVWYQSESGDDAFYSGVRYTTTPLSGDTVLWVATVTGGCTSVSRTSVAVVPLPILPPPVINPTQLACAGGRAYLKAFTADGSNVLWFTDRNAPAAFHQGSVYVTSVLTADTVLWVAAVADGCTSPVRSSVLVDVGYAPAPPKLAGTTEICAGQSAVLEAIADDWIMEYNWYESRFANVPLFKGRVFVTPVLFSTQTYWVTSIHNGCSSKTRTPIEVKVIPFDPEVKFIEPDAVCAGSVAVVSISGGSADYTYHWYTDGVGGRKFFEGTEYRTAPVFEDSVFWVSVSSDKCSSLKRHPVKVRQLAYPVVPPVVFKAVCRGDTTGLRVSNVQAGVSYLWYESETGGTPVGVGAYFRTPALWGDTRYYVSAKAANCETERKAVDIPVRELAPPYLLYPAPEVCPGAEVTLVAVTQAGTNYWYSDTTNMRLLAVRDTLKTDMLYQSTKLFIRADDGYCRSRFVEVPITVVSGMAAPVVVSPAEVLLSQPFEVSGSVNTRDARLVWDFGVGAQPRYAQGVGPHKVAYNVLGEQHIKLSSIAGITCTTTTVRKVLVKSAQTTGMGQELAVSSLKLYPNPVVGGRVNLVLELAVPAGISIRIYDNGGREVFADVWSAASVFEKSIDVTGWASGVYSVVLVSEGKQLIRRLIIE